MRARAIRNVMAVIGMLIGVFCASSDVFAVSWSDTGTGVIIGGSQNCQSNSDKSWGNCLGGSWVYYRYRDPATGEYIEPEDEIDVGTFNIDTAISRHGTWYGNTVPAECGRTGGFWNLGFELHRLSGGVATTLNEQIASLPVDDFAASLVPANGGRPFYYNSQRFEKVVGHTSNGYEVVLTRYGKMNGTSIGTGVPGDEPEDYVYSHYENMRQNVQNSGSIFGDLAPWPDLATFCSFEKLNSDKSGRFQSVSTVRYDGVTSPEKINKKSEWKSADDESVAEVGIYQSTVKVTFKHYLMTSSAEDSFLDTAKVTYNITQGNSNSSSSSNMNYSTTTVSDTSSTVTTAGGNAWEKAEVDNNKYKFRRLVKTDTVTVNLNSYPTPTTICQRIEYTPRHFYIEISGNDKTFHKGKKDGTEANSKKASSACITFKKTTQSDICLRLLPFDTTINYGNTAAISQVINYSRHQNTTPEDVNGGWVSATYAKPGDEIQYRHCYEFGAQAVASTDIVNGNRAPGNVSPNTFSLSASPSNDYLFDRKSLATTTTLPAGEVRPEFSTKTADLENPKRNYAGFAIFSPSLFSPSSGSSRRLKDSYNNNAYTCSFYDVEDVTLDFHKYAYQIPGFSKDSVRTCKSKSIPYRSSGQLTQSDAGKAISQTLNYSDIKAWINESVSDYGACGCATNRSSSNIYIPSYRTTPPGFTWGKYTHTCHYSGECCTCQYCLCTSSTYSSNSPVGFSYPLSQTNDSRHTTATAYVPYNFKTTAKSRITTNGDSGVIYAGETVESRFTVNVIKRKNPRVNGDDTYRTITPRDTTIKVVALSFGAGVNPTDRASSSAGLTVADILEGGFTNANEDPCSYFRRVLGTSSGIQCGDLNNPGTTDGTRIGPLNAEGDLYGTDNVTGFSGVEYADTVPDVEVGSKYCVAVGISHADSHNRPNEVLTNTTGAETTYSISANDATGASPRWRISNVSCRTVAKKPNFQIWGSAFSNGGITSTTSVKRAGASVSNSSAGVDKIFGSWSEVATIAYGPVGGFASGASLGYIGQGGGADPNVVNRNYCNLVKITVANTENECRSRRKAGQSGIILSTGKALLDQIRSRYTPSDKRTQILANNQVDYVHLNDGEVISPTVTQLAGTKVFESDGTIYIDANICTGAGSCNTATNRLVLAERNNTHFTQIESIPQVIIIAKNVVIDPAVTQIDAWIFAENEIDTCSVGAVDATECSNTLIFNGPIFASSIALNRTAGAYPGPNNVGRASANADLASDLATGGRSLDVGRSTATNTGYGSVTPAEIFNVRPDVYLWAYNQANRLSQASVVYMRELAPRY